MNRCSRPLYLGQALPRTLHALLITWQTGDQVIQDLPCTPHSQPIFLKGVFYVQRRHGQGRMEGKETCSTTIVSRWPRASCNQQGAFGRIRSTLYSEAKLCCLLCVCGVYCMYAEVDSSRLGLGV